VVSLCRLAAQDYPSVYERLKAKVASGQFLPVGGTWVEMVKSRSPSPLPYLIEAKKNE
jgi:hypothetical protein